MPTLHVRNVPEVLYEALRVRAEREGRSIGSQAIELLQHALLQPGSPYLSYRMAGSRRAPEGHYATRARRCVGAAADRARELGHERVEPEHVLLALLDERPVARALESLHVDVDGLRERVRPPAAEAGEQVDEPQFGPRTKKVLELALRESLALGQRSVGIEHLLLGVAREGEGPAAEALAELGADEGALRFALLGTHRAEVEPELAQSERYRVVALKGSPEAWTDELNGPGAEGWELLAVSSEGREPRAIFRRVA